MNKTLSFSALAAYLMLSTASAQTNIQEAIISSNDNASFEQQVDAYIKLFPYQETYKYIQHYSQNSVNGLNVWLWPKKPDLVKAGEDKVVRMNNDTYYNSAVLDLRNGSVVISTDAAEEDRFYSFQLQDDRNANYKNIIQPAGEYTFYYGKKPTNIVGKAVEVPSSLSIIIVRIEVKDKDDAKDVFAATKVYQSLKIAGEQPSDYPMVDVLSQFSQNVTDEADKRISAKFLNSNIPDLVKGFNQTVGKEISYLSHAAATKAIWGGPDLSHSVYDTMFVDVNEDTLDSNNGTYTVTSDAPNVHAFWSVTAYDTAKGGHLHPNKDDRYHINNTTAVANSDGTFTFMFKQACEIADLNCLDVPKGKFDVIVRYYLPSEEILKREWIFPLLKLQK